MNLVVTNLYIFLLATVFAILEIQIEGPAGWARNLPTWRPKKQNFWVKFYMNVMSGKELTGYHLSIFSLVLLVFMLPFFLGLPVTSENFVKILAYYFITVPLWDFIWFVLNPWYPLKNFKKDNVNHKSWFLGMPTDYYFGVAASLAVVLIGQFVLGNNELFTWWLANLVLFILETVLLIFFSLNILKIDNWKVE